MPLVFEGEGVEVYIFAEDPARVARCFDDDLNEVVIDLDTLEVVWTATNVSAEFSRRSTDVVTSVQIYLLAMWEQFSKPVRD